MFNFLDSYDNKLQSLQLIITTNIVLLAHYRSRGPLSYKNCNFSVYSPLKSSTYFWKCVIPVVFVEIGKCMYSNTSMTIKM